MLCMLMLGLSVVSNYLPPHGLWPILCLQDFPGKIYWSGLPFPSPGNLPNPGIETVSSVSPALAGEFFTTESPGMPLILCYPQTLK